MTIRRQYSLPNCTLILEGLSDGTGAAGGQLDPRPLITILVNAECYFTGQEQSLSGGRDFFESLVRSVSRYAQEFLSHVPHPKPHGDKPELVQFQKVKDQNLHRLTVLSSTEALPVGAGAGMIHESGSHSGMGQGTSVQLYLTTVQLFDLVEAIDQCLADRQTLPGLGVPLQPISKRYRKGDQPLTKRAAPAALGMTSLALAAIAFFLVPVPEVRQPKPLTPQPNASEPNSTSPDGKPQATATPTPTPPSASELENVLSLAPEVTDPTQLRFLQRRLYNKIDQAWENRGQVDKNLEYRVSVGKDGAIVGYKPANESASGDTTKQTPLPDLLYIPATGGTIAATEPIAQFRVVFNNRGILQISPWGGYKGKPSLGPEITDASVLQGLNEKLYNQIREAWGGTPSYQKELVYRVAVNEEGVIADYEPKNQPASDYVQETPLERLLKSEAAGANSNDAGLLSQKPLAQFRVVFKQSGVLEVSPFRGYR